MASATQYVTLGIANEIFAAPVERVQEILDMRPVARLPRAPGYLLGMIDVRGQGIPVIDLRLKLGLEPAGDTDTTRVVVLKIATDQREITVGLRADRVFEVTVLDSAELEAPPEIGVTWRSDIIAGIGRRNGAFVTVLDLDHLFAESEAPLLEPNEAELIEEEAA